MCKQLGIHMHQIFLIAIYNSVAELYPERNVLEKYTKFKVMCSIVLACHRRLVPFALIDLTYLDKLKRQLVCYRIQFLTNQREGRNNSQTMSRAEMLSLYMVNDTTQEDFEFDKSIKLFSLIENLNNYAIQWRPLKQTVAALPTTTS